MKYVFVHVHEHTCSYKLHVCIMVKRCLYVTFFPSTQIYRCPLCSNFESVDSPSAANEKGASVMAGIAEVSRKFVTCIIHRVYRCMH